MARNPKKRVFRNENRIALLVDFLVLCAIGLGMDLLLPGAIHVGRNMAMGLSAMHGLLPLVFMVVLEKYSIMISGRYEKTLINVLSTVYSLVIMVLLELVLFGRAGHILTDVLIAIVQCCLITAADIGLEAVFTHPRLYRKPRMLIIGSDELGFSRMKRIKYGVLGKYDSWYEDIEIFKSKDQQETNEWISQYDAVCVFNHLRLADYARIVDATVGQDKDLFIVPDMVNVGMTSTQMVRLDDVLALYMPGKGMSRLQAGIKRAMDIVIALAGLIVAAIPMLIIAAAIKKSSPGPVFYRQTRMTKDKKTFEIYKFRTMIPDAEKFSGPKFAEKDDPRITPIGKILRSYRLDELPQIFNILKGEMSVVGPRPERPVFVEQFEQQIHNYDYRFCVKAGLTSLSHVYGRYSTYIHDRTYYDVYYVTHYSLLMDLKIILLTSKTLFIKTSAEGEDDYKEKTVADKTTA